MRPAVFATTETPPVVRESVEKPKSEPIAPDARYLLPTHYTDSPGAAWRKWKYGLLTEQALSVVGVHSFRFIDGREWDQVNGWSCRDC